FHVLSNEPELRDASRVKFVLVAEGHRLKCEDRFARSVHRFYHVLVARRGDDCAKVTMGVHNDPDPVSNNDPADSSDKCGILEASRADPNRVRVIFLSPITNVDVVAPLDICASKGTYGNVAVAEIVTVERISPDRRVAVASREVEER